MEKVTSISEKYINEIEDINEILRRLYDERIYGINGNNSNSDGSMQQNITKLTKQLNKLINKIEFGKDSINDEINNMFKIEKIYTPN